MFFKPWTDGNTSKYKKDIAHGRVQPRAWVSRLQLGYIVISTERGSSVMRVHFRPGGAAPLFDFPISELTSWVVELDLILEERVELFSQSLAGRTGHRAQVRPA